MHFHGKDIDICLGENQGIPGTGIHGRRLVFPDEASLPLKLREHDGYRVRPGSGNAPVGQQEWALQVQLSVLWRWVEGQGGSLSFQLHFGPNFVLSHLNRIMLSSHSIVVLSCQQVQRQRRQYSAVPRDYDHSLLAVPRGSCLVIASLLGHYGCVLK